MHTFFTAFLIVSGLIEILTASNRPAVSLPPPHTDKTIAKIHECHDKNLEAAITRDDKDEYATCVKKWDERKKDMKKGKYI